MGIIFLLLFYIFIPVTINYLCFKSSLLRKIGAILIAYIIGLIIGNVGLFPEASQQLVDLIATKQIDTIKELISTGMLSENDVRYFKIYQLQDTLTSITIVLALPLLLFSLNVRSWFKVAGTTFFSLFLGLISVIIPIFIGFFLFKESISESWKVAGMMTGVYSGGTPNLASIAKALEVNNLTYILTHTYDLVIGAVFLVFILSIGQKVLLKFLPAYKKQNKDHSNIDFVTTGDKSFFDILKRKTFLPILAAIGVSVLIVGLGVGFGELTVKFDALKDSQLTIIILTITTLGILASLIKKLNSIPRTFDTGMFFILIFSVVVASMADLRNFSSEHLHIFYWVALVYVGSLIIHVALAAIFKIDADNVIIVSTALTCSPPFVPVVASALKNKEIILSGLTVGIIGYAIGNYLGIILASIFEKL